MMKEYHQYLRGVMDNDADFINDYRAHFKVLELEKEFEEKRYPRM